MLATISFCVPQITIHALVVLILYNRVGMYIREYDDQHQRHREEIIRNYENKTKKKMVKLAQQYEQKASTAVDQNNQQLQVVVEPHVQLATKCEKLDDELCNSQNMLAIRSRFWKWQPLQDQPHNGKIKSWHCFQVAWSTEDEGAEKQNCGEAKTSRTRSAGPQEVIMGF